MKGHDYVINDCRVDIENWHDYPAIFHFEELRKEVKSAIAKGANYVIVFTDKDSGYKFFDALCKDHLHRWISDVKQNRPHVKVKRIINVDDC